MHFLTNYFSMTFQGLVLTMGESLLPSDILVQSLCYLLVRYHIYLIKKKGIRILNSLADFFRVDAEGKVQV